MLDTLLAWLSQVLDFGSHWPDLTSLVIGSTAGFLLTIALERYFLPGTIDPEVKRRQQGYTFVFCWITSTIGSALFWHAIDPIDSAEMRWTVSGVVSVGGFFFYPAIARYLTARFPEIGTAWNGKKDDAP